jgi:hypothetical protein
VATRPGVTSTIIGATRLDQLDANLRSLEFEIPGNLAARLETAGRPELVHPYHYFEPGMRSMQTGFTAVHAEPERGADGVAPAEEGPSRGTQAEGPGESGAQARRHIETLMVCANDRVNTEPTSAEHLARREVPPS